MDYKVTKLDRRHTGRDIFKYYITPAPVWGHVAQYGKASVEQRMIQKWRVWLWEKYGPGCERDFVGKDNDEIRWAWDTEHGNKRIYLKSDAEMTFFNLNFAG